MSSLNRGNLVWAGLYLVVMAIVAGGMFRVRHRTLQEFVTPAAQQRWEQWREEAARQAAGEGSVSRRIPKSSEPPTLVLMRDHFAICLAGTLIFSSALFASIFVLLRGMSRGSTSAFTTLDQEQTE